MRRVSTKLNSVGSFNLGSKDRDSEGESSLGSTIGGNTIDASEKKKKKKKKLKKLKSSFGDEIDIALKDKLAKAKRNLKSRERGEEEDQPQQLTWDREVARPQEKNVKKEEIESVELSIEKKRQRVYMEAIHKAEKQKHN